MIVLSESSPQLEGEDFFGPLTSKEYLKIQQLATTSSKRIGVPYLAVDIGQLADDNWILMFKK